MKNYYALLGLESDASAAAIKGAYRKKAAEFHPDRNTAIDAPQRFREVQQAYEVLSDLMKRHAYDESRRRSLLDNPLETAEEIFRTYLTNIVQ